MDGKQIKVTWGPGSGINFKETHEKCFGVTETVYILIGGWLTGEHIFKVMDPYAADGSTEHAEAKLLPCTGKSVSDGDSEVDLESLNSRWACWTRQALGTLVKSGGFALPPPWKPVQSSAHSIHDLRQYQFWPSLKKKCSRAFMQRNVNIIITSLMFYTNCGCFCRDYNLNLRLEKGNPVRGAGWSTRVTGAPEDPAGHPLCGQCAWLQVLCPGLRSAQLQCVCSSLSRVRLCDPMGCSPGSSVHGIL